MNFCDCFFVLLNVVTNIRCNDAFALSDIITIVNVLGIIACFSAVTLQLAWAVANHSPWRALLSLWELSPRRCGQQATFIGFAMERGLIKWLN